MSALLDEIIVAATDGKEPLPDILRKCLRLGHELKNERLKEWANQELNGYESGKNVPEYRIVQAPSKGDFLGPFHFQYKSHIIPSIVLEEKHRDFATTIHLTQSVSAYDELSRDAKNLLVFPWPANMVVYYQERLMAGGFICHSAWQEIPPNVLVEMLDIVRNRTLKMALEIKDELGTSYEDLRKVGPTDAEKIQGIVVQNTGGNTYIALGHGNLDASTHTQTSIAIGDRHTLNSILGKAGLDAGDLKELTEAIQVDGDQKPGTKVVKWIEANAPKIVTGGVKIGVKIGQELLTQWLMQYYGLH